MSVGVVVPMLLWDIRGGILEVEINVWIVIKKINKELILFDFALKKQQKKNPVKIHHLFV
jgi:hypothetical protein